MIAAALARASAKLPRNKAIIRLTRARTGSIIPICVKLREDRVIILGKKPAAFIRLFVTSNNIGSAIKVDNTKLVIGASNIAIVKNTK